jgi:hypothetical protein
LTFCIHVHLDSGLYYPKLKCPVQLDQNTQAKAGIYTLLLKREIEGSYNTVWKIKQKIMQVMKEQYDEQKLSGKV